MKKEFSKFINLLYSETARNTYTVFIGNLLSAFFAFIFTVTLVRVLTLADFGYFSALLSLMILVTELSDIGIGQSLSSFLPPLENNKEKLDSFFKAAFILQIIISLMVSLLIILFSGKLSEILFHTPKFSFLVILTAVSIFCSVMVNFISYSLSARKKFTSVALLTTFGSLLRLLLLLGIVLITIVTLDNSVVAQTASLVLILAISIFFINFNFLTCTVKKADINKLMRFAYLLGIARMFTAIAYRLDVLMLISLKNATEAGIYSTASRVISVYPLLAGSFLSVIAPKISTISGLAQLKKYLKKIILATSGLILTIFIMIIFAYPFITLLFGEKTASAVPVFQLLLISMIFFVASVPAVAIAVFYLKKPFILTWNSLIQLGIVIIGNLLFIPPLGKFGPAFSLIIAYGLTLIITVIMTIREFQLRHKVNIK